MLGQGERTAALERRLAAWQGARGGVGVGSGSAAILLALKAMDIGAGAEVIVPTYVCRSVAEAVVAAGARPSFCDSGPDWVITPEQVRAAASGHSRAVIVPHLYGFCADVAGIRAALKLPVIEDLAQAVPAEGVRNLGGDIGIFSFHPTKCLTAGEGGLAISARSDLVDAMRRLRDGSATAFVPRLFSPLSDLAAALVTSQLDRYAEFLAKRREIAALYYGKLASVCPGRLPRKELFESGMHFRFVLRGRGGLDAVAQKFAARGITVRKGVDELLHRVRGEPDRSFPQAVAQFNETISLPIHPGMTMAEAGQVADAAADILRA
jgi:UDP-4-amino-4-deoxy-L-arabinose-oxoglutarate aminotransferase